MVKTLVELSFLFCLIFVFLNSLVYYFWKQNQNAFQFPAWLQGLSFLANLTDILFIATVIGLIIVSGQIEFVVVMCLILGYNMAVFLYNAYQNRNQKTQNPLLPSTGKFVFFQLGTLWVRLLPIIVYFSLSQ